MKCQCGNPYCTLRLEAGEDTGRLSIYPRPMEPTDFFFHTQAEVEQFIAELREMEKDLP